MELHDCLRPAFPAPVNHNVIVRRGLTWELHLWLSPHPKPFSSLFRQGADKHEGSDDPSTALYIDAHRFVQMVFVLIGVLSSITGLLISRPPQLNYFWIPPTWLLSGTYIVVRFERHWLKTSKYVQSLLSKPPAIMDRVRSAVWQDEINDASGKELELGNPRLKRIVAKNQFQ
jgi:hypothetical protein